MKKIGWPEIGDVLRKEAEEWKEERTCARDIQMLAKNSHQIYILVMFVSRESN